MFGKKKKTKRKTRRAKKTTGEWKNIASIWAKKIFLVAAIGAAIFLCVVGVRNFLLTSSIFSIQYVELISEQGGD